MHKGLNAKTVWVSFVKNKISLFAALTIVMLMQPLAAAAQSPYAVLSASNGSGMPGAANINISVSLSSFDGAEVSAVNFDLNYDSSRLSLSNEDITAGPAASSAGKTVSGNIIAPGTARVIIFGTNQTPILDGVIVNFSFDVLPGATPGTTSLTLSNTAASSPDADPVSVNTSNGTFTVLAPPATNTPTSTATRTATATSTSTSPPADTATATPTTSGASPTPSRTPRPSNTPSSGATNTSAPAATATNTNTASAGSDGTPEQTPSPTSTGSPPVEDSSTESPESDEKTLATDLESSIAATGTAYMQIEDAVAATGTALAQTDPGPVPAPSEGNPSIFAWIGGQTDILLLGGLGLVAMLAAAAFLARYMLRRRSMNEEDPDSTQPTQPVG